MPSKHLLVPARTPQWHKSCFGVAMHAARPRRILATLGVGLTVLGGTVAALWLSRPLDPRAALAGVTAAGALTTALLVLIWARHRAEAPLAPGHSGRPLRDAKPGSPVVIPLGGGQAAVIFDEPAAAPAPAVHPAAARRAADRAADAIWDAVDAAVAGVGPDAPAPPPWQPRRGEPGSPPDGTR